MGKLYILFFFFVSPILCIATVIDPDTLIHKGSSWKYLDNGIYPGPTWTQASFNDSSWSTGNAELGYGDNDETTLVGYGPDPNNKYITTYFRQSFNFLNASTYKGIRIDLKRDDGAVVYLNGQEVYRSNMPAGTITDTTQAISSTSSDEENYFTLIAFGSSNILNGINQIAVEVHQNDVNSSDMSFDLSLIADTDVEIVRGPYLQIATPNSMTVCWRTSIPEISKVNFGLTQSYTDSVINPALATDHVTIVTGLQPNTKYYYAVCSSNEILQEGPEQYFITPPLPGTAVPVRIWAIGDMGSGTEEQNQVRDAYYNYIGNDYTNIFLLLGDNAYTSGTDEEYSNNFFSHHYESVLAKSVVYSSCGNHDYFSAWGSNQTGTYYDIFTFPKNAEAGGVASGNEAYYSFNYSNIHFICLESNIDSFGTANLNQMTSWLNSDLAANTMPWTVVSFHCPPYSMGYHNTDVSANGVYMRQNIVPILESYNVDLVVSGHSHDYERTYLLKGHYGNSSTFNSSYIINPGSGALPNFYDKRSHSDSGTVYCVAGCGSEMEQVSAGWPHPAMYVAYDSIFGSMAIKINGDTLDANLIDRHGAIRDNFTIIKNAVVGVDDFNADKELLNIYPNPANSLLNISYLQKNNSVIKVDIYNSTGKLIRSYSECGNFFIFQTNIEDLSAGVYIVVVNSNSSILKSVFIKE
jgi:hypothetical protein